MYYKCITKVNFEHGGSHNESSDWIKKKNTITNPKNTDNKCCQYVVTVTFYYEEIKWNPERVSNIKPLINKYNWKGMNYPSKKDGCKTFEKNNPTIALNIFFLLKKKKDVHHIFQKLRKCEKQIILLMIPNKEKQGRHYFAVKICLHYYKEQHQKHHGDFYCMNYLHCFRTENKLKYHEKVCQNKNFYGIVMPSEKDNVLEFNTYSLSIFNINYMGF